MQNDKKSGLDSDDEDRKIVRTISSNNIQQLLNELMNNDSQLNLSRQLSTNLQKLNWTVGLTDEEIFKYESQYNKIFQDVIEVPSLGDVLKLDITHEEKCDLFEKIIILNNISTGTAEFYSMKKSILKAIKRYSKFKPSKDEVQTYTQFEKAVNHNNYKPAEYRILDLNINDQSKLFIYQRYKYLLETEGYANSNKLKQWIDTILTLPTQIKHLSVNHQDSMYNINKYLWTVKNILDKEIYGLHRAKEKILFLLNNRIMNKDARGLSFAICGPPGTAKTSLINALSKAIELPFFKINLGGAKDSAFFVGHNYTYDGSMPGVIVQALQNLKYKNGIIYFDEFDKLSNTEHGAEISRTMLHIIDTSQNDKFHDRYVSEQVDIDLSYIWFCFSMNDENYIDPTLRDRISIIHIDGYDKHEKYEIARNFIIPRAIENISLPKSDVVFTDEGIYYLIEISERGEDFARSGVRQLKYLIEDLLMKINFMRTIYLKNNTHPKLMRNMYKLKVSFDVDDFYIPVIITKKIIDDLRIGEDLPVYDRSYISMYA